LKTLIELHTKNALLNIENSEFTNQPNEHSEILGLDQEQANLMISAIEIRKKNAKDIMIKFKDAYLIDYDKKLGERDIQEILEKGFSRIPVYYESNNNILGILRLKNLIGRDFSNEKSLRDLNMKLKMPLIISPNLKIIELLREFIKGRSHMAIITNDVEMFQNKLGLNSANSLKNNILLESEKYCDKESIIEGIITLEDVIENMINLQIFDEDDYEKMAKIRECRKKSSLKPILGN